MAQLTENGYDYYKSKEYWTPAEAAGFVSGVHFTSGWLYTKKDYDEISLVLDASIEAFKTNKLQAFKEIERRSATNSKDFYESYCPDFCRHNDVYQGYYLSCFDPLEYMKWIVTEKIMKIPYTIGVTIEDGLNWNTPPKYDKDNPIVHDIKNIQQLSWKDALHYKSLDCWTISEGVCLSQGNFPGSCALFRNHINLIERSFRTGEIEPVAYEGEDPCFSPFVLLEKWKKAGFTISPLFNYTEKTTESDEVKYSWIGSDTEGSGELAINENGDETLQRAGSNTGHLVGSGKSYTFPGKQIASWEDLEIVLISKESVEINTNGHSTKFSYHELGMAHKNNPDNRKEVWHTLIRFAINDGKISSSNSSSSNPKKDKDRIKEFKNWCKSYFNLDENIYKHHYRTHKSWETKFKIRSLFEIPPQQEDEPTSPFDSEVQETIRKSNLSDSELYQD